MKNTKLTRNEDKTFNVVDTRTGEVVKARVSGGDAAAYRVYYEEMLVEAEANWEILGGDRETKEEEETTTTNPIDSNLVLKHPGERSWIQMRSKINMDRSKP